MLAVFEFCGAQRLHAGVGYCRRSHGSKFFEHGRTAETSASHRRAWILVLVRRFGGAGSDLHPIGPVPPAISVSAPAARFHLHHRSRRRNFLLQQRGSREQPNGWDPGRNLQPHSGGYVWFRIDDIDAHYESKAGCEVATANRNVVPRLSGTRRCLLLLQDGQMRSGVSAKNRLGPRGGRTLSFRIDSKCGRGCGANTRVAVSDLFHTFA